MEIHLRERRRDDRVVPGSWWRRRLGGGKIRSRDLAKNAVRTRNLAPHAVTNRKVKKQTLRRSSFKKGTLPGLNVVDFKVSKVLGAAAGGASGFGTVVGGPVSFTPRGGKSYLLEVEMRGRVTDADGAGGGFCSPSIDIWVNDKFLTSVVLFADADSPPQLNNSVASSVVALGLTTPGQTQTITPHLFGDSGCGAGSLIDELRVIVVQLG